MSQQLKAGNGKALGWGQGSPHIVCQKVARQLPEALLKVGRNRSTAFQQRIAARVAADDFQKSRLSPDSPRRKVSLPRLACLLNEGGER
jgi:hypothetical protein